MMISTVAFRSEQIGSSWSPSLVYSGGSVPQVPSSYSGLTDSARKDCLILGNTTVKFDLKITEVIRAALFGDNYGFALSTERLSGNFPTSFPMTISSVQITYSDNSGLNSYQSNHSISIDGSFTREFPQKVRYCRSQLISYTAPLSKEPQRTHITEVAGVFRSFK